MATALLGPSNFLCSLVSFYIHESPKWLISRKDTFCKINCLCPSFFYSSHVNMSCPLKEFKPNSNAKRFTPCQVAYEHHLLEFIWAMARCWKHCRSTQDKKTVYRGSLQRKASFHNVMCYQLYVDARLLQILSKVKFWLSWRIFWDKMVICYLRIYFNLWINVGGIRLRYPNISKRGFLINRTCHFRL